MKPTHIAACAAAPLFLVLAVLLWRQGSLEDEISTLRATLEAIPRNDPGARATASGDAPGVFASPTSRAEPRIAEPADDSAETRIAELERVANAQADLIEELMGKFDDAEQAQRKALAPGWSALQAIGPPDSAGGDQRTAWASAQADGGEEWLLADFAQPTEIAQIIVSENCAPGAITKIVAVTDSGAEVPLWQGEAPKVSAPSNTPFAAAPNVTASRVKICLDTKKVPGWNEIDAVQLVGRDGSRQWVRSASASSTYGSSGNSIELGGVDNLWFDGARPNPTPSIINYFEATPAGTTHLTRDIRVR